MITMVSCHGAPPGGTGFGAGDPEGLGRSPEGRSDFREAQGPQRHVTPNDHAAARGGSLQSEEFSKSPATIESKPLAVKPALCAASMSRG
jgi:hypothetical protein